MKKKIMNVFTQTVLLLVGITSANAEPLLNTSSDNKVHIKCYVELLGGDHIVYYNHNIPRQYIASYQQTLLGKDISSKFTSDKKIIYKVIECKEKKSAFKDISAKGVDENPRDLG